MWWSTSKTMDERIHVAHQKDHGESSLVMVQEDYIDDTPIPLHAEQEERQKADEAIAFHGKRFVEVGDYHAAKRARRISLGGDDTFCLPRSHHLGFSRLPLQANDKVDYPNPRRNSTNSSNSSIHVLKREVPTFQPPQANHHPNKISPSRVLPTMLETVVWDIEPVTALPLEEEEPLPEPLLEQLLNLKAGRTRVAPKNNATCSDSNETEACLGEDFVPGSWDVVGTGRQDMILTARMRER
jgi:hypothetical protein